ncbi:unnamed protein product, partial [Mesorhabditis belari]|uniref:G-protein coupled receptors family 1 profile domain-containing protein n=1 Tax=Mesorhabditis belari TaxID=2138241 RepID=A0AAF3EV84_9BILA
MLHRSHLLPTNDSLLLPPPCYYEKTCQPINIPRQVPFDWALPLYGYVMPLVVVLTMITNSFIVVVLSHKYLRTPTNFVLLAMAVSELLTGLSCIPWFLYYYTFGGYTTDEKFGLPAGWCVMIPFLASFLPSVFHATAIWLTVYLAIQRYVYICIPTLVRRFCTIKYSKKVLVFIWVFSTVIYAPDAFANYHQSKLVYSPKANRTFRLCYRTNSGLLLWIGHNLYYKVFYSFQTIFVHTGPCILLVIFTWKLVATIRVADKRHAFLMKKASNPKKEGMRNDEVSDCGSMTLSVGNNSSTNGPRRDYNSVRSTLATDSLVRKMSKLYKKNNEPKRVQGLKQNTRMLLVVIFLFLITEIPAAMIFTVHVLSVSFNFSKTNYQMLNTSLIVRNVLIVISYPFRFAIYCGMSQQFREVVNQMCITRFFKNLFSIFCKKRKRDDSSLQLETSYLNDTRRTVLQCDNPNTCTIIGGTKDTGIQCDFDSTITFDPLFDDMQLLADSDPEDNSPTHEPQRSSRGTQCSAKIDKEMFVRRKSSLVAHALLDVTTGCHVPVVISIST